MIEGVSRVGVVGGGTMGAGIARTFAAAGYPVRLRDIGEGAARARRGRDQEKPRAPRRTRQADGAGPGRDARTDRADDENRGPRRLRRRGRGRAEALRPQEDGYRRARQRLPSRRHSRDQHLVDLGRPHRLDVENSGAGDRHAFLQSRPDNGAADDRRNLRENHRADGSDRQEGAGVENFKSFVVNRVLIPMTNEGIDCVYEGLASPEDVDQMMKLGANHPMGPLSLADLIGLDIVLDIYGDPVQRLRRLGIPPEPAHETMCDAAISAERRARASSRTRWRS